MDTKQRLVLSVNGLRGSVTSKPLILFSNNISAIFARDQRPSSLPPAKPYCFQQQVDSAATTGILATGMTTWPLGR
jgi:hypothetical protein